MCGRYVLHRPLRDWHQELLIPPVTEDMFPFDWPPANYNIAPTTDVVCVYVDAEVPQVRVPILQRWGLVPFWADDLSIGNRMINARSETVADKPSFRSAMKRRRCLIPADGYYEWKKLGKTKQPYYIHDPDSVIAMAGLWEENTKASPDGSPIRTCTIITTRANSMTGQVHDRMPVIIEPDDQTEWLDPANDDVESLQQLFEPAQDERLAMHPVPRAVGNVRNKGPHLIQPIAPN